MACVNTMRTEAQGWGPAIAVANAYRREPPRWYDADGGDTNWWHSLPTRTEGAKIALARVMHTWTRAYLVALKSNADCEGEAGAGSREVWSELTADGNLDAQGRIKMGAVIASFEHCPGDVVYHTLCLLNWAGHVNAYNTLNSFSYAMTVAVFAYWSDQSRRRKDDDVAVRAPGCSSITCFEEPNMRQPLLTQVAPPQRPHPRECRPSETNVSSSR